MQFYFFQRGSKNISTYISRHSLKVLYVQCAIFDRNELLLLKLGWCGGEVGSVVIEKNKKGEVSKPTGVYFSGLKPVALSERFRSSKVLVHISRKTNRNTVRQSWDMMTTE